jgi:L-ascorbate metabolism protein UlaG (beta-lactamase superfamily)
MRLTHVGTATLLLEAGGKRLVTDPALDPAGRRYRFRPFLASTKTEEPALPPGGLEPIDLVLLSHDHHADNLDEAGRALLPRARRVLTTIPGARRLGGNALGLAPWQRHEEDGLLTSRSRASASPRPSRAPRSTCGGSRAARASSSTIEGAGRSRLQFVELP